MVIYGVWSWHSFLIIVVGISTFISQLATGSSHRLANSLRSLVHVSFTLTVISSRSSAKGKKLTRPMAPLRVVQNDSVNSHQS